MRKGIVTITLLTVFILGIGLFSGSEVAAQETAPNKIPLGPTSGGDLRTLIMSLINWLFVALLLTATIFIVLAAFQLVTGGGDPTKVSEARQKLLWAAIAVVAALFARSVPTVIINIIGT